MATPDIEILVGAKGGYTVDGESAKIIRAQLQTQLNKGLEVNIKVGNLDEVKKSIEALNPTITVNTSINNSSGNGGGGGRKSTDPNLSFADAQITRIDNLMKKFKGLSSNGFILGGSPLSKAITDKYNLIENELVQISNQSQKITFAETKRIKRLISELDDLIKKYGDMKRAVASNSSSVDKYQKTLGSMMDAFTRSPAQPALDPASTLAQLSQQAQAESQKLLKFLHRMSRQTKDLTTNQKKFIENKLELIKKLRAQYVNEEYATAQKDAFTNLMTSYPSADATTFSEQATKEFNEVMTWLDLIETDMNEVSDDAKKDIKEVFKLLKTLMGEHMAQVKQIESNDRYIGDRKKVADDIMGDFSPTSKTEEAKQAKLLYEELIGLLDDYEIRSDAITASEKNDISERIIALRKLASAEKDNMKALEKSPKIIAESKSELSSFNKYLQRVDPKALRELAGNIAEIRNQLDQAAESGNVKDLDKAKTSIKNLKSTIKDLGYEGGNIFTYLQDKVKTFFTYMISSNLVNAVVSSFVKMKDAVLDLDKALVNLQIVTGASSKNVEELLIKYNNMARALGSTTTAVATGATDWLRQGYSEEEADELLTQSMTLSIVGAMDAEQATDALTASLKGYALTVQDASSVVDKFFKIDMAAATSSSDMALALAKTAANAKLAGLSLDDVIAQLAVVNETMKESGEETGSFYNTMLSRMGNIKGGRLEDPLTGESLSKVESTLSGLKIQLRDSEGQFRNFGEVLAEVGGKWDSFSNTQQRAIATAFAGTLQQTRFVSLMQGWEQASEYAEQAADSTGVAAEKLEIYQEGLEARSQKLAASFEKLSMTLFPDELMGMFMDAGAALLDLASAADAIPLKFIAINSAVVVAITSLRALKTSSIAESLGKTVKDLAGPEIGQGLIYIAANHAKDAA